MFTTLLEGHTSPYAPISVGTNASHDNVGNYYYDTAGNRLSDGYGQTFQLGLTGKPIAIESSAGREHFNQGLGNFHYLRQHADGRKTLYLANQGFEYRLSSPADPDQSPKSIVQIRVEGYSPKVQVNVTDATYIYAVQDSLGSVLCIVNQDGVVPCRRFAPWGAIVNSQGVAQDLQPAEESIRGFTGHETIASMNLIHMNGRVYEPQTSTMMGPDRVIGHGLPSLNRYCYVANNPLNATDSSGWSVEYRGRLTRRLLRRRLPENVMNQIEAFRQNQDWHLAIQTNFRGDIHFQISDVASREIETTVEFDAMQDFIEQYGLTGFRRFRNQYAPWWFRQFREFYREQTQEFIPVFEDRRFHLHDQNNQVPQPPVLDDQSHHSNHSEHSEAPLVVLTPSRQLTGPSSPHSLPTRHGSPVTSSDSSAEAGSPIDATRAPTQAVPLDVQTGPVFRRFSW